MFASLLALLLSLVGGAVGLFGGAFGLVPKVLGPVTAWIAKKQLALAMPHNNPLNNPQVDIHYSNDAQVAEAEVQDSNFRLSATSTIFKYGTFFLWFYPFIIGQIRPLYAHIVFDNLAAMPAWYTQSCVIIMFAIWGISVSAPVISTVFGSLGSFLQERRDHHERLAAINRGAFFDSMKKQVKGGKLSQEFVNVINKALDDGSMQDDNQ